MKTYLATTRSDQSIVHDDEEFLEMRKPRPVKKVWGSEEIIFNDSHCVKVMRLKPGYQVSMHWHAEKEETFILHSGELIIDTIDPTGTHHTTRLTTPLESFTLLKNVPHTFYCPDGQEEETVFIEASTKDNSSDSYRVYPSQERQ